MISSSTSGTFPIARDTRRQNEVPKRRASCSSSVPGSRDTQREKLLLQLHNAVSAPVLKYYAPSQLGSPERIKEQPVLVDRAHKTEWIDAIVARVADALQS